MESGQNSIRKKRILLVEDELDIRELIKSVLRVAAYEVVEAKNGTDAIAMVAQHPFDLVITDYKMPLVTGSELAVRIRQLVPSLPILMITGDHTAVPNAVDAVLWKPFSVENFRTVVARLTQTTDTTAS